MLSVVKLRCVAPIIIILLLFLTHILYRERERERKREREREREREICFLVPEAEAGLKPPA
jgi:hypothetical protein